MNTQIKNLELKINDLVMRMDDAEQTSKNFNHLTGEEMNEINNELKKLKIEFDSLKIKIISENSDEQKITTEIIEDLIKLIEDFINNRGKRNFQEQSFCGSEIENYDLRVNYSCEIEIEQATIDVGDYFVSRLSFRHDDFLKYVDGAGLDENQGLIKFLPEELFDLIYEIIEQSVSDVDTSPRFDNIDDFECELCSNKKVEITDITIDYSEMCEAFDNEFQFPEDDIRSTIRLYHNFSETYSSEDDSEQNSEENSEEN
jgi:hypothetical protein